jgi:hypothetical protein
MILWISVTWDGYCKEWYCEYQLHEKVIVRNGTVNIILQLTLTDSAFWFWQISRTHFENKWIKWNIYIAENILSHLVSQEYDGLKVKDLFDIVITVIKVYQGIPYLLMKVDNTRFYWTFLWYILVIESSIYDTEMDLRNDQDL